MSHLLKTVLIKLGNLIDKILVKIDKPQPIRFPPYPTLYTDTSGNTFTTTYCPTCVGTTTSINIYDDPK